mmetsp:Transcript_51038/g.153410  ORF Transcript_51038/g.153410 Transcript_51038/m.153410 type:complete len:84 (-) Transcript_51038:467-718(-)
MRTSPPNRILNTQAVTAYMGGNDELTCLPPSPHTRIFVKDRTIIKNSTDGSSNYSAESLRERCHSSTPSAHQHWKRWPSLATL